MKLAGIFLILIGAFFGACSKSYNCQCTNPGGTEIVFKTRSAKTKAEKKCSQYYDDHYGNIPLNETQCEIN